jgi:hypothetical protein
MGFQVNTSDKGGFTIPVGSLNSSLYNQSQTWSSAVAADSGSTFVSNQGPTKMFNGVASGGVEKTELTSNGSATFTSPVQLSGTLRIYIFCGLRGSSATGTFDLKLDGVSVFNNSTFPSNAGAWVDFGTKTWTTLQFGTATGGNWLGIAAIEVAGQILVDAGVTPPAPAANVPSIASQVMASPESGFSIVKYTGNGSANATTGHGLNEKPSIIIYKDTDTSTAWRVIPAFINDGHYLALNNTNEIVTGSTSYFGTSTNSVIGITGSNSGINNASGKEIIAYCLAPVAGYSAMGSYVGTGSSPNFVYLGFRPKLIIIKNTNGGNNWLIQDSERSTYNLVDDTLHPNTNDDEDTSASNYGVDFLSNGFALRTTGGYTTNSNNASEGHTYIYMAFAENPFQANGGLAR